MVKSMGADYWSSKSDGHLPPVSPEASDLTSLSLDFLIHKVGMMIISTIHGRYAETVYVKI